jgi:hypothetical protein
MDDISDFSGIAEAWPIEFGHLTEDEIVRVRDLILSRLPSWCLHSDTLNDAGRRVLQERQAQGATSEPLEDLVERVTAEVQQSVLVRLNEAILDQEPWLIALNLDREQVRGELTHLLEREGLRQLSRGSDPAGVERSVWITLQGLVMRYLVPRRNVAVFVLVEQYRDFLLARGLSVGEAFEYVVEKLDIHGQNLREEHNSYLATVVRRLLRNFAGSLPYAWSNDGPAGTAAASPCVAVNPVPPNPSTTSSSAAAVLEPAAEPRFGEVERVDEDAVVAWVHVGAGERVKVGFSPHLLRHLHPHPGLEFVWTPAGMELRPEQFAFRTLPSLPPKDLQELRHLRRSFRERVEHGHLLKDDEE